MKSSRFSIGLSLGIMFVIILIIAVQSIAQDENEKDMDMQNNMQMDDGQMMEDDRNMIMQNRGMHDGMRGGRLHNGMTHQGMMHRGMTGKGMGMGGGMMEGGKMMGDNTEMWRAFKMMALYDRWLGLVDDYEEVVSDSDKAGVAAIMSAQHVLMGMPDEYMAFLEKAMPTASSDTVKRAIQMEMATQHLKSENPQKRQQGLDLLTDIIADK